MSIGFLEIISPRYACLKSREMIVWSFTQEAWLAAVEACVPPKTIEANRRAFLAGWQLGEKA